MNDRRDGIDRRDDEHSITLGELYRLCQRIELRMTELGDGIDKDVHTLRSKLDVHNVSIEVLKLKVFELETKGRDWRGWLASGLIGAVLATLPFLLQWMITAHR